MDVILDTCGLLSLAGIAQKRGSKVCLKSIASADQVHLSSCSLFEISLKHKRSQLDLAQFKSPTEFWQACIETYELTEQAVTAGDFANLVTLPDHHADPFDRIIIAQSQRLNCPVITYDAQFRASGVDVMQ
jgi:PIN domain nuclease of toxin-antitoxin system